VTLAQASDWPSARRSSNATEVKSGSSPKSAWAAPSASPCRSSGSRQTETNHRGHKRRGLTTETQRHRGKHRERQNDRKKSEWFVFVFCLLLTSFRLLISLLLSLCNLCVSVPLWVACLPASPVPSVVSCFPVFLCPLWFSLLPTCSLRARP